MTPGRANSYIAGFIFLVMLAIYLATAAPSLSFWDCGEFIACSYIMGIPHPPGAPLLSLIGRVFSMIPFYDFRHPGTSEIAFSVNMLDVILGALTVMMTYLVIVRIINLFREKTGRWMNESVVMFSAAVAAFLAGFTDEFWTNSVETETYMPSLFIQVLALWLVLKWHERRDDPFALRYLFAASYIIGFGNGVHLTVVLMLPTILLIVLFAKPEWFSDSRLWFSVGAFLAGAAFIKLFAGYEILHLVLALFAFGGPPVLFWLYHHHIRVWRLTFYGIILCTSVYMIGYTVYPTVMVRAGKDPAINEGNPDNWERYKLYLSRDQYGQGNMYTGMFERKADFSYQFGFMYLRYLIQQYPSWGPSLQLVFENDRSANAAGPTLVRKEVWLPVLLLGVLLYGLYTHGSRDKKTMLALLVFFAANSVGLVLYLNMDNPQVRERAYFFLGSYYILTYWIGIGIYGIITDVVEWARRKGSARAVKPALIGAMVVFGTIPPVSVYSHHIDPDYTNYEVHDRTEDWMPWDYGYNILVSCEKDAVLFTNGDNDTFPLWYLQEVMGFRKDVRIVNLSLLNTDWYILQQKHQAFPIPGETNPDGSPRMNEPLPIEYSDDYISNRLCGDDDDDLALRMWPAEGREVNVAGISWNLPAYHKFSYQGENVGMLRVQDVMIANIINWLDWERPVYFAVTVANENKINLNRHLAMEGMVYRLMKEPSHESELYVNVDAMEENVFEKYQYRSLSDPDVYKPENTLHLVTNYFIGFAQLSERYASRGDRENAVRAAWAAINRTPNTLSRRLLLYQTFVSTGMDDVLREFAEWELESEAFTSPDPTQLRERLRLAGFLRMGGHDDLADTLVDREVERLRENDANLDRRIEFGTMLISFGLDSQSTRFFEILVDENPAEPDAWKAYTAALYNAERYREALAAVDTILTLDPGDTSARETRKILQQELSAQAGDDSLPQR